MKLSPYYKEAFGIWIGLLLLSFLGVWYFFDFDLVINVFISLNIASFLLMMVDKTMANGRMSRVPEKVLYLITFLGGSIGLLVGMQAFRHKTRKTSFQLVVFLICVIQVVALYYLTDFIEPEFFLL